MDATQGCGNWFSFSVIQISPSHDSFAASSFAVDNFTAKQNFLKTIFRRFWGKKLVKKKFALKNFFRFFLKKLGC